MMRFLLFLASLALATAEDGSKAWLRYARVAQANSTSSLPASIIALNTTKSSPVYTAGQELAKGIQGIFGKRLPISNGTAKTSSIIVGTAAAYEREFGNSSHFSDLKEDGFWLSIDVESVRIIGQNERGALYGAFEYLSHIAQGRLGGTSFISNPNSPIRWVNEWDNLDGTIERGYAGPSIFFKNGVVVDDLTRVAEYARLLASIKINGIIINNVNAKAELLNSTNIEGLARIADVMRPFGVQVGISLNFASPQSFGLKTFDPLDTSVISWWNNVTNQIYSRVPDMAGYLVKANSEGQPGPLTYNRTLADGANMFAKVAKPHGGIVMFRAFVYDNHLNESHWKDDRANAAVEFFKDLDGKFDDNVVVQIKYGAIDFQVREPVSPLFAHLPNSNTAIELQVTQEYLGQQAHLVYLAPMWKETLEFDMRVDSKPSKVQDIISGQRFKRPLGGSAAVVNVGTDTNWLGHHLALSNLYAYGRLAWNPSEDAKEILQDWISLTFSQDQKVIDTITKMSLLSWPAYENYTGNLGIQTLTDITGNHFGPNPRAMDNNGWGQWTRADSLSIGMDRTVSNGTGNAGQYPKEIAEMYENIETTPEDLLLWFHHVPYTQKLKSGKTVIQHFYDSHYAGAETAASFVPMWESLKGKLDEQRYNDVLFRQIYQAGHAVVWRDAINNFYHNLSSIEDEQKRVGRHPWRIEAEGMQLSGGYVPVHIEPPEAGSNSTAIAILATNSTASTGSVTTTVPFESGTYDIGIQYFDISSGRASWSISLNNQTVGQWIGNLEDKLGKAAADSMNGHTSTRITFLGVKVQKGDMLRVTGKGDGKEGAGLDYVVFLPKGKMVID
ncbi:alpha-glucuronidase [Delitschia confertaspora ATCC 74209]|uniref:Alpha-glucuronidase n=1 Tax=Delitschia confertaspora ATCC 74209 TaxID=1513339 RepID=A0A9P4MS58_9PLEO|nr:alpha-glucuronidase [Delitschia confertaspora ATCC 74209]